VAVLPLLAERMLASGYPLWWQAKFQYDAFLVMMLCCAAVDGAARLQRHWPARWDAWLTYPFRRPAWLRGAGPGGRPPGTPRDRGDPSPRTPLGLALAARARSQLPAQSGGPASSSGTEPCDQSSSRASTCLHGNFRLGQEHRYAGPDRSATARYGAEALPRHSPHTAPAPGAARVAGQAPVADQARADASDWAARCDGASGARASTRSRSQRSATLETLVCGTDIRRGFGAG
jgi:hypothetical protein